MKTLSERLARSTDDLARMARRHARDSGSTTYSDILALHAKLLARKTKVDSAAAAKREE